MTAPRLGRHINISHGFVTAPQYANDIGCSVFQIFLGSPQMINNKKRNKQDLVKFAQELESYKQIMVVHGSYTINLCHPPGSTKFDASIKSLVQDLEASSILGDRCLGVIIHMGKNIPTNQISDFDAIDNYVEGLHQAITSSPATSTIILETGASQGSEVGSQLDELAEIYWKLPEKERHRVTFCIDTCHIWATGYKISNQAGVDKFFTEFDDKIGIDKISCIHFNDSQNTCCSNVDRHADLAYGKIGKEGLKAVALFAKKHDIPLIMETPLSAINPKTNRAISYKDQIRLVKGWLSS